MKLSPIFGIVAFLVVNAMTGASVCSAQAAPVEDMQGLKIEYPKGTPTPTPFPLDIRTGRPAMLEFRAPAAMTTADRDLAASAEGEIARRAGLQGFRLDQAAGPGGWGYEQAVCPVFPDHLILEYSRDAGPGDLTLFSVVIPRGSEGHVRVIPVRRRGYSLWTPASSNALTLNDFNHMVKEGGRGVDPDWLTLSLCYAALAGGHIRAALAASTVGDEHYPLLAPALLTVTRKGGATVALTDTAEVARTGQVRNGWELIFAQSGRLVKVRHAAAPRLTEHSVPGQAMEVKGLPTAEQPAGQAAGRVNPEHNRRVSQYPSDLHGSQEPT